MRTALGCAILVLLLATGCRPQSDLSSAAVAQSRDAVDRGDPRRAISILEARLSFAPRDLAARSELARVWLSLGEASRASQVLRELPSDVAVDVDYRKTLARALVELHRIDEAAPVLAALSRDGELDGRLLDRWIEQLAEGAWSDPIEGRGAIALAAFPDSVTARDSPAKLEIEHRRLHTAGRHSEAAEVEALFLERYPTDPASYDIALTRSKRLLAEGQPEPSLALARQAAALDPSRAAPWVQQSLALDALDRAEESLHALDRALAADPYDTANRALWSRAAALRDRAPSRRIVVEIEP